MIPYVTEDRPLRGHTSVFARRLAGWSEVVLVDRDVDDRQACMSLPVNGRPVPSATEGVPGGAGEGVALSADPSRVAERHLTLRTPINGDGSSSIRDRRQRGGLKTVF